MEWSQGIRVSPSSGRVEWSQMEGSFLPTPFHSSLPDGMESEKGWAERRGDEVMESGKEGGKGTRNSHLSKLYLSVSSSGHCLSSPGHWGATASNSTAPSSTCDRDTAMGEGAGEEGEEPMARRSCVRCEVRRELGREATRGET